MHKSRYCIPVEDETDELIASLEADDKYYHDESRSEATAAGKEEPEWLSAASAALEMPSWLSEAVDVMKLSPQDAGGAPSASTTTTTTTTTSKPSSSPAPPSPRLPSFSQSPEASSSSHAHVARPTAQRRLEPHLILKDGASSNNRQHAAAGLARTDSFLRSSKRSTSRLTPPLLPVAGCLRARSPAAPEKEEAVEG